jgi:hypothetical protein
LGIVIATDLHGSSSNMLLEVVEYEEEEIMEALEHIDEAQD